MSNTAKTIITLIVIAIIAIIGYEMSKSTSNNLDYGAMQSQNATTGANANDASDNGINQDMASVNAEMGGLSNDSAAVNADSSASAQSY